MIHQNTIYTAGIETEEQVSQLTERISNMIGVHQVNIKKTKSRLDIINTLPASNKVSHELK